MLKSSTGKGDFLGAFTGEEVKKKGISGVLWGLGKNEKGA